MLAERTNRDSVARELPAGQVVRAASPRECPEGFATPRALKTAIPRSFAARARVEGTRERIRRILHGGDRERLLVVVGPCSIHSCDAALEYAEGLRRLERETANELVIVMRTYFEKPRTRGGWKGLINDPHLDGSCDVATGLRLARKLLLEINELGVACATEFLDPLVTPYLGDLVSWAAIGARTSESPVHRELASGLSIPVGFKNATDGRLEPAVNAVVVARQPHTSLGFDENGSPRVSETRGNRDAHVVLRGGGGTPNCDAVGIARATDSSAGLALARPLVVDCSHDNSGRVPERQATNAREIVQEFERGTTAIAGLMIESNLLAGSQRLSAEARPAPGISLTDPCLGWGESASLLRELAARIRRNRGSQGRPSGA